MNMVKSNFMKSWTKLALSINNVTIRKLLQTCSSQKKRISVNFQIDCASTCSILPVGVYKETSGDHDLQDLNTTVQPTLLLYDEKTKIQTLGTRKCLVFNPATRKEGIIQFRIVNEDLTPLLGLRDSEELRLLELLQENIATLDCGKPFSLFLFLKLFLHLLLNYTHHSPWQPFRLVTLMCLMTV